MQATADLTLPRPFRRSQQHSAPSTSNSPDAAVIATNSDAAVSKASCVRAGYFEDEFLKHFVDASFSTSSSTSSLPKRPPLINRGYFCRHAAISGLVTAFLSRVSNSSSSSPSPSPPSAPRRAQVVSLGAGSDTLFFRLHAAGKAPALYVELDLPEVVSRKAETIVSTPRLAAMVGLGPPSSSSSSASSPLSSSKPDRIVTQRYALLPCDLRSPAPISTAIRRAQEGGGAGEGPTLAFDPSAPTLFVSECVLVYLPPSAGDEVLRDAFEMLRRGGEGGEGEGGEGEGGEGEGGGGGGEGAVVVFDPCRPGTAFGRQMAANLRARGCELPGVKATPDPEGAAARLRRFGWECGTAGGGGGGGASSSSSAADLGTVWARHLPAASRALASRVERLDELEEFNLIMEHYFLAVGVKKKKRAKSGGGGALEGFGLASLAEER